jgi:hypothetical protein
MEELMMENKNQTVEAEFTEVDKKEGQQKQPLKVRLVLTEGAPIEITIQNLSTEDFQGWINSDMAGQLTNVGLFVGNIFVPMSKVRYFEQVL